jgi:adenylate cyclase
MIFKFIKYFGVFSIFIFSAFSIFMAYLERELPPNSPIKRATSYTAFFEDRFYDVRMRMTLDKEARDERLVLAAIDDHTLNTIGIWPLPRTTWVTFMDQMAEFGAKVVAFDVFFSENALSCPGESPDQAFSDAIARFQSTPGSKVILPYSLNNSEDRGFEELPDIMYNFIMDTVQTAGSNLVPNYRIGRRVFPIETLLDADPALAIIETTADLDGIFRHYKIAANVDELYFPSYSLQAYELYTGDRPSLHIPEVGSPRLRLETGDLNLNIRGETKIRWFGDHRQFEIISLNDILTAEPDDEDMRRRLEGKIIYIGSTAFGAHDLRHTPIDSMMPGVFFHMNMTHMLLTGNFFKRVDASNIYSWVILLAGTALILIVMFFGNAIVDLFTMLALVVGLFLYDTYVLLPQGYEIKLFFCLFSIAMTYSWQTFLNFYMTSKEKNKIRGTFSSFVAPAVVDQMLANPDMVRVGGQRKNITVFFSDVRDFTSISEKLSPEELANLLNGYMGVMTDIIFDNNGTLDKYIGDAIVAFWGAPLDVPDHAYQGVCSAIKMVEALPELNKKFKELGFPELEHGMGLNTGECSVGNMGSDKIFSYTALGDNMNLGARAEALCKFYGVEINITEFTLNAIREELRANLRYRILDKVRVKGKEQAVSLYEVFHPSHPLYNEVDVVKRYHEAFDCYQQTKFQEAVDILKELLEKFPEDPSFNRVLKMCQDFIELPPPPGWDGVFTHKTKG